LYPSDHIQNDIMYNHAQKQKLKKVKTQDSMGKPTFISLWTIFGNSQKDIRKFNSQLILNKNSPEAHT
jgi:hypothetical protein